MYITKFRFRAYITFFSCFIHIKICCSIVIFTSSGIAIEDGEKSVNDKFKFIEDIYSESWALIIGINDYQNVPPLSYAEKDAVDIKNLLQDQYGFKKANITISEIVYEDVTSYVIEEKVCVYYRNKDWVLDHYKNIDDQSLVATVSKELRIPYHVLLFVRKNDNIDPADVPTNVFIFFMNGK